MKTINNFIVEHLEYSTFPINEKLKISSKSKTYNYYPKDNYELRKILEERLDKDKNANLNDIDVSEITDMSDLFKDLYPHNIDISKWDVSNVTDMCRMFFSCYNFNADLNNWDVSKVTNMYGMFYYCKNFKGEGLENWKVSNVTNMIGMLYNCEKFNCDLSNWDVSKVTNMQAMFNNCKSLKYIPCWYK